MSHKPRLAFLGVGWIGLHRMQAVLADGAAEIVAIADANPAIAEEAAKLVPHAAIAFSLDELLLRPLDGIVIATPSALHAQQALDALERGVAVFCQKPLGRNAAETADVIDAARSADKLLGVDLSYRSTSAIAAMREEVAAGNVGRLYAADLVFHNAYGPDKPWFYDARLSGGGCLIDLGIHLIDLALWMFGDVPVRSVLGSLFSKGKRFVRDGRAVEDYAIAEIELDDGAVVRIACSWNLHAGREAVIGATFYGTEGAVALRNENGSFYDFIAEVHHQTECRTLVTPPDAWGGRAAVAWARQLARSSRFDESIAGLESVARVIDTIYAQHECASEQELSA